MLELELFDHLTVSSKCVYKSYIWYICKKQDLTLNNPQGVDMPWNIKALAILGFWKEKYQSP